MLGLEAPSKEYWWGYHKYNTLPQVLCLDFFGVDQWINQEIDFTSEENLCFTFLIHFTLRNKEKGKIKRTNEKLLGRDNQEIGLSNEWPNFCSR